MKMSFYGEKHLAFLETKLGAEKLQTPNWRLREKEVKVYEVTERSLLS